MGDHGYHITKAQQKPGIITVGSEDPEVTCFVQLNATIKLRNSFVNGSKVFKLESIKLHQEANNHARAKCIVNANDNLHTLKANELIRDGSILHKLAKLFITWYYTAILIGIMSSNAG